MASRRPGEYELDDDDDDDAAEDMNAGVAPYPAMAEADLAAAVEIAGGSGASGEVVLTDRGLKGRQVLSLREPLANWAAASIVHLDLSRNRLRDKGASAVVKVLAGNSSIKRLQLEHNGIGDPGAAALGDLLRKHASITDVNLRRNAFTDTGARALVVALHENHTIQLLDVTKNKTVSFSMHEAARLAAETNRMRHKGMLALDTLATLYETVEVIKGELGLMASMPIEDALNQACTLLGLAGGGEDAANGADATAGVAEGAGAGTSPLHDGDAAESTPDAAAAGDGDAAEGTEVTSGASKMLLTERAEAVISELGMRVTPVKAQNSRDRVLRSLALGYAAQPADVAHLDGIARASGVSIKEILGFARAQLEAEKSLATADVNPIMEDDRTRRRRYRREQEEAARPAPQPTVLEQLAELLDQAVGKGLLTQAARSKIDEKVHNGKLNPTTCMVQWSQKLQVADEFEGLWAEASAAPASAPATQTVAPERQPDWKQVIDEQSGKSFYFNRRTRETRWSVPPGAGFVESVDQRDTLFEAEDDGQPGFEEWSLPGANSRPAVASQSHAQVQAQPPAALTGDNPLRPESRPSERTAGGGGSGPADDIVVDFEPSEMGQLAWRETPLGTVQLARAPERVLQPAGGPEGAAGGRSARELTIGMLLNSVGVPSGFGTGGDERVPVGMLSYAGAVDQIDLTAAQGRGLSLGFVRNKDEHSQRGSLSQGMARTGTVGGRQPGDYGATSSDDDDDEGMFSSSAAAAAARGAGTTASFAASLGVQGTDDLGTPAFDFDRAMAGIDPMGGTQREPQRGDRWVVIYGDGAIVRSGCEMSSTMLSKVSAGDVVRVVTSRTNSDGLLRLCIEEPPGWVSVKASDGTPLLREAPAGLSQNVTSIPGAGAGSGERDLFALTSSLGPLDEDVLLAPPPPPKTLAQQAATMVERALEHDQAEEVAEAVSCYQQAAMHLHAAAKEGKSKANASETQCGYYRSKATEYLQRADELSHLLAEQRRRDAERQKLLDTTSKQLALADQPLGSGVPLSSKAEKRVAKQNAKAVRKLRRDPCRGTVDEVVAWLATIECAGCAATFVKHEIDGETLLELSEAQLRDDLGITRMGDRARIRRERDRLKARADDFGGDSDADGAPPPPPPPDDDKGYDELFGKSQQSGGSRSKSKSKSAKQARKAKAGLRGTAPPPPPPIAEARVKVSARWVGAAAGATEGADWVHVKMDGDEAVVLSSVKQRLGVAMQMSPLAFSYMQYQDKQGEWSAACNLLAAARSTAVLIHLFCVSHAIS